MDAINKTKNSSTCDYSSQDKVILNQQQVIDNQNHFILSHIELLEQENKFLRSKTQELSSEQNSTFASHHSNSSELVDCNDHHSIANEVIPPTATFNEK